ncbi:HD domain-containing protein [Streptomyces sp. DSM 44915]|uniref:HD domain-containing protein n=1 Tax=Streptomyces chisholmiae TaxID=3075540 RepID=A0ABU2JMG3_9ACTN|nr:HD domain-containing protein [Streptomyces sp. DSM 44915]MDT0266172.1 HD domain-containing protein [Streptomyces sp. DSM 44915]
MTAEATTPSGTAPTGRGHRRVRLRQLGRAAVFGSDRHRLPDAIEHLAKTHRRHHPRADLDALRRAYLLAEAAHRGQTRKSGEPYITHPLAVTLILAELGAETTTLTASLLHDTVEDTEVTLEQVRADFGAEVAHLVDGVTKLEKVEYGAAAEPETFRKMLVATGSDVRVMSIKLADRVHNMRTLGVMRPEKQARIARVTRDVLIPLAERLGVHTVKTELEDLVFAVLHPAEHQAAQELVLAHRGRPDPLAEAAAGVRAVLREAGIAAEVQIRPRHLFSVHRARLKRGELGAMDYGRLLILVAENADCYAVLGELHTCFTPVVADFKDFVAAPKFNLYQSLHTAFATPGGAVAEVLVRTHAMHRVAETGVVALGDPHRSPEGEAGAEETERADPTRPGWLSRLLKWQEQATDPDTFWTELRDELARDREITVFAGDAADGPLQLPVGATCVDAAYARHGQAAHSCVGARVNGRLAALRTVLRDGDTVQLLLAGDAGSRPSPEWLEHATTPAARVAIRSRLENGPEPAEYEAGEETRRPAAEPEPAATARATAGEAAATVPGAPEAAIRLARCCTPVPPDAARGFLVRGGAVTVHREECPTAREMAAGGRAPLVVNWRSHSMGCRVTLQAEALGRPELLADLTEALAQHGAAVLNAEVEPPREQRVRHTYTLRLPDASGLPRLMRAMRRVPGVYDVSRAVRLQP